VAAVISPHSDDGGGIGDHAMATPLIGPRIDDLGLLPKPLRVLAGTRAERGSSSALVWQHLLLADLVALVLATAAGVIFRAVTLPAPAPHVKATMLVMSTFGAIEIGAFAALGLYRRRVGRLQPSSYADAGPIICAAGVASFVTGLGILAFHGSSDVTVVRESELVAVIALASVVLALVARSIAYMAVGAHRPTRVLIIGSGMVAQQVGEYLSRGKGAQVVGYADDDPAEPTHVMGRIADVPELCERLSVDNVLVSFTRTHPEELNTALRSLQGRIPIGVVPRFFELMTWRSRMDDLCGLPIIDVAPPSLSRFDRFVKRTFDLVASALVLLVLLPVFVAVGVAIRFTSPGPVLFRQTRTGRWGEDFTIYKFRTMQDRADDMKTGLLGENESDGPLFKMRSDPRLTRIGELLRRTSFDELPQVLNVLRGDMSLVGPRPFVPGESKMIDGWAKRRFEVRPGLTGLWQVSGRSDLSYEDLQRLDYTYVASWSLAWDVKILWQTPGRVFRGNGAY
jgi:exopolysaccharide biosynthesis polyprenyl glycosylphosphotransferase